MAKNKFYITTPIYYVNGIASIGHAYTTIISDIIARWKRLEGYDVAFLTGTDENASKTVEGAKKAGYKDIQKYADDMAQNWVNVWKELNISNTDFIRTTDTRHKKFVLDFFDKAYKKGDVYKGKYVGLYCEGCEGFVMEKELVDGKCPYHKTEPKQLEEENYFFKLSKYQNKVLKFIEDNPGFVQPETRRNEIISFIKGGLRDISISRADLEWGIDLPIDKTHRFWVWFDALTNYISADPGNWPADIHMMAKDIIKFHAIYWPAMLMSAGYKLPKKVYAHGFMTINGHKMSKSLGNVIDPLFLKKKYSTDSVRYHLSREIPLGEDGDFSEKALVARHNNELANDLGNLLNRTVVMINNYFDGKVVKSKVNDLPKTFKLSKVQTFMDKLEIHNAVSEIWKFVNECNKYINDNRPWELEKKGNKKRLGEVLYNLGESLRVLAIVLYPFIPETAEKINQQLCIKESNKLSFKDLKFGGLGENKLTKPEILFNKIEDKEEKKMEKPKPISTPKAENYIPFKEWGKMVLRVGKIIKAEQHPNADKLYVLLVDFGPCERDRQVVAGIKEYYKMDELIGKKVTIFCNLQPTMIRGIESNGMILAAEGKKGEVGLLVPDREVIEGARVC